MDTSQMVKKAADIEKMAAELYGNQAEPFGLPMTASQTEAEPMVRTDERNDLSYSWQVYYELNIGAVRLEEARVVKVDVLES